MSEHMSLEEVAVACYNGGFRACADAIRAHLRECHGASEPETAWLIERGQAERQVPTVWWTGSKWSPVAADAQTFASESDCQCTIDAMSSPIGDKFGRASEHVFMGSPRGCHEHQECVPAEKVRELIGKIGTWDSKSPGFGWMDAIQRHLRALLPPEPDPLEEAIAMVQNYGIGPRVPAILALLRKAKAKRGEK